MSDTNKKEKNIRASTLLSPERFDIAVKLAFLREGLDRNSYSCEVYRKHLEAFGFGSIREPGNPNKNSLAAFIQDFEKISEMFSFRSL